jgi:hypothetical protein
MVQHSALEFYPYTYGGGHGDAGRGSGKEARCEFSKAAEGEARPFYCFSATTRPSELMNTR